jgi:hypothetical protein
MPIFKQAHVIKATLTETKERVYDARHALSIIIKRF